MKEIIEISRLNGGPAVLTDRMPDVRSATLGFFYDLGARHEPPQLNGISHFIEHTIFKGTKRRSALDIAVEQDRLGGSLDAFTTHEETGFAIKVIDDQVERAFDLLADMLANAVFDEKELKSERRVIIEEMKMIEDSPEEYLGDLFGEALFPGHPLGKSIAGTPKTVRSFGSDVTREYHNNAFHHSNLVIVAAGNVEHRMIRELAEQMFKQDKGRRAVKRKSPKPTIAAPIMIRKNRNLEQAHLIVATPFMAARDETRYAGDLLANIIGGGMSSRLWQEVRERRGLAYNVGASTAMFRDCGFFSIYAGTSPKKVAEVLELAIAEMRKVASVGIDPQELELAKQQTSAAILLGLEDSAARAAALAQSEMMYGRYISADETLSAVQAVTAEQIQAIARKYFKTKRVAFAALGDLNGLRVRRGDLNI